MSTAAMPELNYEPLSPDFEAIFRQHSPLVYRTARAVIGNSEDAEDVVQTIFLKLMRGGPDYRFADKTNLPGIYSINLSFSFQIPPPGEAGARGGGGGADPGAPAREALGQALEEQLGLRLERAKVAEDIVVIEHAEKPTEN